MRTLLAAMLCGFSAAASALQVDVLEVSRDQSVYHVVVDVLISAPPERVRTTLLDVNALRQLNPSIKGAHASQEPDGLRVTSELEECLFGFCRQLLHVQKVQTQAFEITAETLTVPGSSFKSGIARWQLTPQGQDTRLLFTADTEPDVWLPPVVGPRMVMKQLREKTLASLHTLERLASE